MKHHFLDRYAHLSSPVHNLNTTAKLIVTMMFVVSVVSLNEITLERLAFSLSIITLLVFVSHIPPAYFLKNLLILSPFVLFAGVSVLFVREGRPIFRFQFITLYDLSVERFLNVIARALISLSFVQIFIATTRFDSLLETLKMLRVPDLILELFSFIYRYVFILTDELMRSKMAAVARGKLNLTLWSHILRGAFVRSFERGRLIYLSMKARGYRGEFRTLRRSKFAIADLAFIMLSLLFTGVLWKL